MQFICHLSLVDCRIMYRLVPICMQLRLSSKLPSDFDSFFPYMWLEYSLLKLSLSTYISSKANFAARAKSGGGSYINMYMCVHHFLRLCLYFLHRSRGVRLIRYLTVIVTIHIGHFIDLYLSLFYGHSLTFVNWWSLFYITQ